MTCSTTLNLNQRFETYDGFLSLFNIERKRNFDIRTKFDCKKHPNGTYIYVKFRSYQLSYARNLMTQSKKILVQVKCSSCFHTYYARLCGGLGFRLGVKTLLLFLILSMYFLFFLISFHLLIYF